MAERSMVEAALAWLRANKPGTVSLAPGGNPMYHGPTLARAASALLILAALHDRGMRGAQVADVALYSAMSTTATRTRLEWLTRIYRVVSRTTTVSRTVWYRVDVDALRDGVRCPGACHVPGDEGHADG